MQHLHSDTLQPGRALRCAKAARLPCCHDILALTQVDEEPPIRANTTILLGNLADHLSEATQKRVLLNAFTRALKDLFPPARVAGLRVRMSMDASKIVSCCVWPGSCWSTHCT